MLKWTLIVVAVLAALVALLAIVGLFLPRGHVATRTARFRQDPAALWRVMTAFADQPAWRTGVQRVERLPDQNGHEVWKETDGRGDGIPFETVESDAPRRLVRRIVDPNAAFGGTWTLELTPSAEGAVLTITERGEVYNPIFRTLSKCFDPRATMNQYLTDLARKFGQPVDFAD